MKRKEKIGVILVLISALGYALMPIFSVTPLREGTPVSTLLFMRFSLTALLLWPYIIIKKIPYKLSIKSTIYLIVLCLLGFTVATVTLNNAYKMISGSIATLILFTHPILVMVLDRIVFKTPTTRRKILAVIITSIGLLIVLYVKEPLSAKGVILAFVSSMSYAVYCLGLTEKNVQKIGGIAVTAYMATTTALAMGIMCLVDGAPLITTETNVIMSVIGLALFATIVASITFYESLSRIGASSTTLISSVEPMIVVFLSAAFLGEVITYNNIIGGLIIIIGIIVLEYKK